MEKPSVHARRWFWAQSLGLFLLAALAYLPLVTGLGYTHDDWFPTASQVSGVSLYKMHSVDRPLMGILYELVHRVLGEGPLAWHGFAFLLRWAGGVIFLWLLLLVWPGKKLPAFCAAALFLVYPGFLLQPSANNYQNHLIALLLGLLSLALMVKASHLPGGGPRLLMQAVSVGLVFVYPLIYEALIGLEAMRLALLWRLRPAQPRRFWNKSMAVLRQAAPYLLALGVFIVWRFVVFKGARVSTDASQLLLHYRSQPVEMLVRLGFETGRDVIESVLLAWFVPLYRLTADAGYLSLAIALLLAGGAAWLAGWFWRRLLPVSGESDDLAWAREALVLGAVSLLFTLLPVVFSNRDVRFSYNFDRYTLQSIPAIAILMVALIFLGLRSPARFWAMALLLGLAVSAHYHNALVYRAAWEAQRQFWWQLSWRAPDLKQDTALAAVLPAGSQLAEGFEIWAPANRIYRSGQTGISITGVVLNPETARQIAHQESFGVTNRTIAYTVDSKNVLIASLPGSGVCLHVIDGRRVELPEVETALVRGVARFSNIDLITPGAAQKSPPVGLFGRELAHRWCFYYQKAELARQQSDWKTVAALGDEAAAAGLAPADVSEWMPFYEAYARLGRIDDANRLGGQIRANTAVQTDLCDSYNPAMVLTPISAQSKIEAYLINNLCAR